MTNPMYLTLNPVPEAMETILRTMHEAEEGGQHTPGSWTKEGALHHLKHSMDHMYLAIVLLRNGDPRWVEEAEHGVTRGPMALWCHKRGLDGDHGPEGAEVTG